MTVSESASYTRDERHGYIGLVGGNRVDHGGHRIARASMAPWVRRGEPRALVARRSSLPAVAMTRNDVLTA